MDIKEMLNVLKKPYGHSTDKKRQSRQMAVEMIEAMEKQIEELTKENESLKKPKDKKLIVNPEEK